MTSLEEMIKILRPTGVYRLEEGTLVYRELQTYAAQLDRIAAKLDEILREATVQTAVSYGLESMERLLGYSGAGLSTEKRRERIIHRFSSASNGFTRPGVESALRMLGYSGTITEDFENGVLLFEPLAGGRAEEYRALIDEIAEIVPARLRFSFTVPAPTWDTLDAQDKTFAGWDEQALPWDFCAENL